MTYSHTYGYVRAGGGGVVGGTRALFPFEQIFENTLYVQNILYGGIK